MAQARLQVAEADEKRLEALYGYTRLTAPYDAIVVWRNANTGDFVLPATGDPSAEARSADQSTSEGLADLRAGADRRGAHLRRRAGVRSELHRQPGGSQGGRYPRRDAGNGPRAAFHNDDVPAKVTRSSWALNMKSRTLRAEIDIDNPDAKLLPGMYAYGTVTIEQPQTRVLPEATLVQSGNDVVCYLYENGKSMKTPIQTGLRSDGFVEVLKKKVNGTWTDFTGEEKIIDCDLSELTDGSDVSLAPQPATSASAAAASH